MHISAFTRILYRKEIHNYSQYLLDSNFDSILQEHKITEYGMGTDMTMMKKAYVVYLP